MPSARTAFSTTLGVLALLCSVGSAFGQSPDSQGGSYPITAYTATLWTTTTEPDSKGTAIAHTKRLFVAQSSSGAVRRESYAASAGTDHNLKTAAGMIVIRDNSKQQLATLDPRTRVAEIGSLPPHRAMPSSASASISAAESLGSSTMAGLAVVGTRRTYTVAASPSAASSTAVVTEDIWFSPQLHTVVKSESHDTLNRSTLSILEDVQQQEPNPSLFSVPSNYAIHRK